MSPNYLFEEIKEHWDKIEKLSDFNKKTENIKQQNIKSEYEIFNSVALIFLSIRYFDIALLCFIKAISKADLGNEEQKKHIISVLKIYHKRLLEKNIDAIINKIEELPKEKKIEDLIYI